MAASRTSADAIDKLPNTDEAVALYKEVRERLFAANMIHASELDVVAAIVAGWIWREKHHD